MQPNNKCGQRYDAEFKENAVALVKSGRTLRAVAGDLGVSTWSLRRWVAEKNNGCGLHEPKTLASETARTTGKSPAAPRTGIPAPAAGHFKKSLGHCL